MRHFASTAFAISLAATACAPKQLADSGMPAGGLWVPPLKQSVYLRGVFDDDPSSSIGRFVKRGLPAEQTDESNSFASRCSKFITTKQVGASGTFDETFMASTDVRGSLSISPYGGVGGSYGSKGELRVKYTLKKKMLAVEDADNLGRCCTADASQCSDKFIREFYMGDGEIFQLLGSESGVNLEGGQGMAKGDVEVKNGSAWKRVTRFENAYFAFKTGLIGGGAEVGAELCKTDWLGTRPTSLDGQYFVGTSKPAGTEQAAFQDAMLDARRQVVQYIGTAIRESRTQQSQDLDAVWKDEGAVTAGAQGLAQLVKDRCQRNEPVEGPVARYKTRVLAFLPNSEISKATAALAKALQDAGKISPAAAQSLQEAGAAVQPPGAGN